MLLLPHANSISFNFPSFNPNIKDIFYQGDAFSTNGALQLTKNQVDVPLTFSVGRASYNKPVHIWDANTRKLTDFATQFTFIMRPTQSTRPGDGLAFCMVPVDSEIPPNSAGGTLGLFSSDTAFNGSNQIVAVEFDTFKNTWDPSSDHMGIDINSIVSKTTVTLNTTLVGSAALASVSYSSTDKQLTVLLTNAQKPFVGGYYNLSYFIDLSIILPSRVRVGFSAATGGSVETHSILSWGFTSSLED